MVNSSLLTYCLNVHPSETLPEVLFALDQWAGPIRKQLAVPGPFPLGLRLGDQAVSELMGSPSAQAALREALSDHHLSVLTLNAFPMRAFHGEEVKTLVYEPNWCSEERIRYTLDCAHILVRLPRAHNDVLTMSTLPLGFDLGHAERLDLQLAARNLLRVVDALYQLQEETGVRVLLCLEPEPLCVLSETKDLHSFYRNVLLPMARDRGKRGGYDGEARCLMHLGACFDICHAAVLFEQVEDSIHLLRSEDIPIGKVQVSSALSATDLIPCDPRYGALRPFAEPRYLHQTVALCPDGNRQTYLDLTEFLQEMDERPRPIREVRSHFHVPIDACQMGALGTTQNCILKAIEALPPGSLVPLEIETYTRSVIPGNAGDEDLVPGILRELRWAQSHLLSRPKGP